MLCCVAWPCLTLLYFVRHLFCVDFTLCHRASLDLTIRNFTLRLLCVALTLPWRIRLYIVEFNILCFLSLRVVHCSSYVMLCVGAMLCVALRSVYAYLMLPYSYSMLRHLTSLLCYFIDFTIDCFILLNLITSDAGLLLFVLLYVVLRRFVVLLCLA